MTPKPFISDADATLANLIWSGIENESAAKTIISSREQILFCSPKAAVRQGTRKLSIFLYNITEEKAARNTPPPADSSGKSTAQTIFALHYLVTPFTGNDKDDHVLLEKIIHVLSAPPPIVNSDEANNTGFRVKMDSLSLDELNKLWIALGAPLRLSLSLTVCSAELQNNSHAQVTSATEAPQTPALDTEPVIQFYQAVLKTFTEQSNGWKKRNIVVRQWLLQDFEKNTHMTVEEMLTALNNLGDKLEHHGSTAQFVAPLNLLAGYYTHQLDQLKGMHKVSHKQGQNLETISAWIKDVKSLTEAIAANA